MMHIGKVIEYTLHEQGRSVSWLAEQLCCTRVNVYKVFHRESIDVHMLSRISKALSHDFFKDLSRALENDDV